MFKSASKSISFSLLALGCSLALLSGPVAKAQTWQQADNSATANSAYGRYQKLLKTIACPQDQQQYGQFSDAGYFAATPYCGAQAPAGYWVWVAPNWYIWKSEAPASKEKLDESSPRASYQGKYRKLLQVIDCPSERAKDEKDYGTYADAGYYGAVSYCNQSIPAGYWVYVAPYWYLWAEKDLAAIGFESLSHKVPLKAQQLTLNFEFARSNRQWAQTNAEYVGKAILDMERRTGIPYPGVNPYPIEEVPTLKLLGLAGPSGMKLVSPPKGTPWTFLHEVVHIWNAGYEPTWVIEGQANYYSFLMMQELKFPFVGDETYAEYIKEWRQVQGSKHDLPLEENYLDQPQGKAMAWWAMIHELFGPEFVTQIFVRLQKEEHLSTSQIAEMLRKAAGKDPGPLLDGWIRKGSYKVKKTTDFGPIRYPLANAWPQ